MEDSHFNFNIEEGTKCSVIPEAGGLPFESICCHGKSQLRGGEDTTQSFIIINSQIVEQRKERTFANIC